jgi:molybdopterin-guanine dinucleotide biosynthesis protein A
VQRVEFLPVETAIGPLDPFFNINTPADLAEAETWLAALEDMP